MISFRNWPEKALWNGRGKAASAMPRSAFRNGVHGSGLNLGAVAIRSPSTADHVFRQTS